VNTIIYAVGGSVMGVSITLGAAFSLSRKELVGRKYFVFGLVFTMIFGGGLIPLFLLIRSLGLYNTRMVMVLLGATGVWYIMIARTFFAGIPEEMYDSARMDGAGDLQYFARIALPLSGALVAVLFLFTIVQHWNSYITAIIFLQDKNKMPLQVVLREILVAQQQALQEVLQTGDVESYQDAISKADLIKYAVIVVASIPVMIFYPFIQRYFVKGVMIGSLKA
jgi:putative aldouronate transport system permease protein